MQEAGRIAAVMELVEEMEKGWARPSPMPADVLLHHYFRERRYIGSSDRGVIAARVYFIVRHRLTLLWHAEQHRLTTGRALVIVMLMTVDKMTFGALASLCDGERFSPRPLLPVEIALAKTLENAALLHALMPEHVRYNYPLWMEAELRASLGSDWHDELDALAQEAPVDVRANTLRASRDEVLAALRAEGYDARPTPLSPLGVRLGKRGPLFTSRRFAQGWFEMQDEGSQLASLMMAAKPGEKIIDFCAGAGGKTLAMGADMQGKGRILAFDTSSKRLDQMTPRLKRAGLDNVQRHVLGSEHDAFIKRHKDSADGVLVDAPCSGSGTWRRNPDLKWRFTATDLQELQAMQASILRSSARLVKKGGRLLYVTCSLLASENTRQIEAFIAERENFRVVLTDNLWNRCSQTPRTPGHFLRLTPHQDGTDGFFAALLERHA